MTFDPLSLSLQGHSSGVSGGDGVGTLLGALHSGHLPHQQVRVNSLLYIRFIMLTLLWPLCWGVHCLLIKVSFNQFSLPQVNCTWAPHTAQGSSKRTWRSLNTFQKRQRNICVGCREMDKKCKREKKKIRSQSMSLINNGRSVFPLSDVM